MKYLEDNFRTIEEYLEIEEKIYTHKHYTCFGKCNMKPRLLTPIEEPHVEDLFTWESSVPRYILSVTFPIENSLIIIPNPEFK